MCDNLCDSCGRPYDCGNHPSGPKVACSWCIREKKEELVCPTCGGGMTIRMWNLIGACTDCFQREG